MLTIMTLREALHEARMQAIYRTGQDVKMIVVVSHPDYASLRRDPEGRWYPVNDERERMSVDGCRLLRSGDLKEGEIKILADLGAL